jgi:hypothetical protein
VERFNQTIAKYLNSFVNSTTLDWELYLAPLMFCYNTSFHRSVQNTPFFLTYGMEPRLPSFPGPDARRMFYGESSAADIFQRLFLARKLAVENNLRATEKGKEYHDRKAKPHTYSIGQKVLLEEYYFLGKNVKLAPKWSGPHLIISLKGTHNVELLVNEKKKVIVNVDRIKPYRIPEAPTTTFRPWEERPQPTNGDPRVPATLKDAPTPYEFDGDKFVPVPHKDDPGKEITAPTPEEPETIFPPNKTFNNPNPSQTENRKRGRPRKLDQATAPQKKNKWSLEAQAPSTSRMTTRSQAKQAQEEAVATLRTSVPCFCGNQRILKHHSWNCKQQMLNWIPTGDPYTWTEDDYAHESEVTEPMYIPNNDEDDDFGLPNLFNETGYRGSSDINPDEPPARLEEDEEQGDDLPNLDELDNLSIDETPPGPPLHQSTPE